MSRRGTVLDLGAYRGHQPKEVEMRKVLLGTLAAGLLILAGGQAAFAKGAPGEELQGTAVMDPIPKDLKPGQPWDAKIRFVQDGQPTGMAGYRPIVQLHDLSSTDVLAFTAFATDRPGWYTARIVFPHAGTWSVVVRSLATGVATTVNATIRRSAPAPIAAPAGRPLPVWSWAVAGALTLVIVGAGVLLAPIRRRQRVAAG